jgi:hypothetical protein
MPLEFLGVLTTPMLFGVLYGRYRAFLGVLCIGSAIPD